MPTVNRATLMGHLGADAETKFTPTGVAKTTFSLATVHSYKKGEEWVENTDWHNIVAWRLNDTVQQLLKKGNLAYIEGRISNRSYEKDGVTKWISEIVADKVHFLRPPFKAGPRDEQAPPDREQAPIDESDIPF